MKCHPERCEGSQVFEKARFFAVLRKTISVFFDFFNSLFTVDLDLFLGSFRATVRSDQVVPKIVISRA